MTRANSQKYSIDIINQNGYEVSCFILFRVQDGDEHTPAYIPNNTRMRIECSAGDKLFIDGQALDIAHNNMCIVYTAGKLIVE